MLGGDRHIFKLTLTRSWPVINGPPVDTVQLARRSTQPSPYASSTSTRPVYEPYDVDVANDLKSRVCAALRARPAALVLHPSPRAPVLHAAPRAAPVLPC